MRSRLHGYCSLLTQGTPITAGTCPPDAAPNALRHWTDQQKEVLTRNENGRKLLAYQTEQKERWKTVYESLSDPGNMTYAQFEWALEVVNSRSFCGKFWSIGMSPTVPVLAPLLTGTLGLLYLQNSSEPSSTVLAGVALLGALPTIIAASSPEQAVLLPLIDSANHLEIADSKIMFDPAKQEFLLTIGKRCLVKESDGMTQLFITYGDKSDVELLNNFGFLPGVAIRDGTTDDERRRLAEAFLERASSNES